MQVQEGSFHRLVDGVVCGGSCCLSVANMVYNDFNKCLVPEASSSLPYFTMWLGFLLLLECYRTGEESYSLHPICLLHISVVQHELGRVLYPTYLELGVER